MVPTLVLVTGLPGTGKSTVAAAVAAELRCAVIGHDWVMSGLRAYPELQEALGRITLGHRVVGWSILTALARAELRAGRGVVLDGVARAPEVRRCRDCAASESARSVVVVTSCSDPAVHRARIEGRRRDIPEWYELEWQQVEASAANWEQPDDVDLAMDTVAGWDARWPELRELLAR